MKRMVWGVLLVGLLGTSVGMAQDSVDALRAKEQELGKKIEEARRQIMTATDLVALKQKADDAAKAYNDARTAKLKADPNRSAADKKFQEARDALVAAEDEVNASADLVALKKNIDDAAKAYSDARTTKQNTDPKLMEAAKKQQEARDALSAAEKEVLESADLMALKQAADDARTDDAAKAYNDGRTTKLNTDPKVAEANKKVTEAAASKAAAEKELMASADLVALKQKVEDGQKAYSAARPTILRADPKWMEAEKKVQEARDALSAAEKEVLESADLMALKQAWDDARTAQDEALSAKLASDPKYTEADTKEQEAREARKEAEQELMDGGDIQALKQEEATARSAYDELLNQKLAADPGITGLTQDLEDVKASIRAAQEGLQ